MMRGRENINLLMADTPAENVAAVDFFMKHLRFTESVPHVYLTRFRDWERPLAPLRVQSEATRLGGCLFPKRSPQMPRPNAKQTGFIKGIKYLHPSQPEGEVNPVKFHLSTKESSS